MNDDNKTVWINAENKILSFHATENGKVIQKNRKPVLGFSVWTDERRIPNYVTGECFMKRTIVLLLAAILCLCFAACNKAAGQENGLQLSQMETTQVPPENSTEASEETVENPVPQDIELVGPWHLDSEKNDLAAFADSLDLFPGYG